MYLAVFLALWNFGVFLLYGADKWKAKRNFWRVPEKVLLFCALLFGALGALLGMKVFHHKTKHRLFTIGVPLCLLLNAVSLWLLLTKLPA